MPDKTIQTEFLIHDLKVPIAVIDAGAKLLLEQQHLYGPLTDKQIKVLKRILRNALVTRRLVDDALELGRSRKGGVSVCDFSISSLITAVLLEVFDLLDPVVAEKIKAASTFDDIVTAVRDSGIYLFFNEDLWRTLVRLDESKTKQILRNLVVNAFKYRNSVVNIKGSIEGNNLILAVEDDGEGIAKEKHHEIFDAYTAMGKSLNHAVQSYGLGLAGVQTLIEEMGATLDLESDKGRGSSFTVNIPLQG